MQIHFLGGQLWHEACFVCAHCFRPFGSQGVFYEFGGRKYCEHDFHVLFAPCCAKCGEFVVGRVIRALTASWHAECFTCATCDQPLADAGFVRNGNKALCHACNAQSKTASAGLPMCRKCFSLIDEGTPLRYRGELYHAHHFHCAMCGQELKDNARELNDQLLCLRCHDKTGIPVCAACHRPIEERVINALGKQWHVEHFVSF